MTTYRFRAECPADAEELLRRIPAEKVIRFLATPISPPLPDTTNEITVRTLTLAEMQDFCRATPDGHVMLQTIQPKELYTGERTDLL